MREVPRLLLWASVPVMVVGLAGGWGPVVAIGAALFVAAAVTARLVLAGRRRRP